MTKKLSRRQFGQTAAAASATALTGFPYIKSASSAGKLAIGTVDHWIPGNNDVLKEICEKWGAANGVEVTVDFITVIGGKLALTAQAESRAQIGHDILIMGNWATAMFQNTLEPVNDVVEDIIAEHGPLAEYASDAAYLDGKWLGSPSPTGSINWPLLSRLDYFRDYANIDLQKFFPGNIGRDLALVDTWDYELFLTAAEKLHAGGHSFGAALSGGGNDSNQFLAALFTAYGASIINESGDISVDSDETRSVLEYLSRLTQFMPDSVYAWDDGSNNRYMISGVGSTTCNPPSPWAVAKRDSPAVAEQLWHHDNPRGPKGRFRTVTPAFWTIWGFSQNIPAAKDLLRHAATKDVADKMILASQGYDLPTITSHLQNNDYWANAEPPKGVLYNYPVRGDEKQIIVGYPAPAESAAIVYAQTLLPTLVARVTQGGESFDDAIDWAANEAEVVTRG